MSLQQLYNGLASQASLQTIHFCTGMGLPTCGWIRDGTGMDLPARTVCWPTAIVAGEAGLQPTWLAYS